jgi:hypothetical protein
MDLSEFPFLRVAQWLRRGEIVPFLGAGASIAGVPAGARLPSGRELADDLRLDMAPAYPGGADDNLAKVAQFYENLVDRPALYDHVYRRMQPAAGGADLASVPRFLATIPSDPGTRLFIASTNYDTQVECAFREAGRPLCVITQYVSDPTHGATRVLVERPGRPPELHESRDLLLDDHPLPSGTAFLYKMHGSANRPPGEERDPLIITEDDYVDFLIHSGGSRAAIVPPPVLTQTFKKKRFLFLGYSLEDWNLRAFLRLLAVRHALAAGSGLRHYAVQLDPQPIEEALWDHRRVTLYAADLAQFVDELKAAL